MLDIALVIPELVKYGGAERFLMECAARWQRRHRITIYATDFNGPMLREHHVGDEVTLVHLSPYFEGEHAALLNCVLLPKLWEHEIGTHDVYNTHLWPTHLLDLHPSVWYPHEPLRVLHDLRGDETLVLSGPSLKRNIHLYPKQKYDSIEYKYFEACLSAMERYEETANPDRIVANSGFTASYLEEVYGREVRDIVYPGVDISGVSSRNPVNQESAFVNEAVEEWMSRVPTGERTVVTIGQLWPHKRIDLVIQACSLVPDVHLCVIGQGPERGTLQALARDLGLQERVSFLEGLSNLQLRRVMDRALAVVFVPRNEPFGIVALETMAAGKPLIAADEGGYTEVIDESCAFLVPARIDVIAEKIQWLKDHLDEAKQVGLAAKQKASAYTWDRTASELLAILEQEHRTNRPVRQTVPQAAIDGQAERPLFGVQYYCWYGGGSGTAHWNDNPLFGTVTDIPLTGYYVSCKDSTIAHHFDTLEDAGIHFVVLNLHVDTSGINQYEKECIEKAFRVASRNGRNIRIAIQVCPYHSSLQHLEEVTRFASLCATQESRYLKMKDRPVLYLFWTGSWDGDAKTIDRLKHMTDSFVLIASSTRFFDPRSEPRKTFGLFDGFSLFSPLEIAQPDQWETSWRTAYRNSDTGKENLKIFTVSPGYDDAHLKDPGRARNVGRTIDRDRGKVFQTMIDCALSIDPVPDQIIVSTFNEFHENTHIEPSVTHGSLYMDMTRDLVRKAAKTWGPRKAS
jgi:glycosyltransferase involved in cell wall biosynthesis